MEKIRIFILQTGIGKARATIFEKHLKEFSNAVFCHNFDKNVTHIVVDDVLEPEEIFRLLQLKESHSVSSNFKVVKSKWVSQCIDKKEIIDSSEFEICSHYNKYSNTVKSIVDESSGNDYVEASQVQDDLQEPEKKKLKWVCMRSSKSVEINCNNKIVIDELEKLMKTYENMSEKWRALGYRKAIKALKDHPTTITCYEEAICLPGIGKQLAEKICEIIDNGKLRKLSELNNQDSIRSLEIFTKVWGAGPKTAKVWVANGFRTLEDLKEKANLTKHQEIGLKYYDDLCEKMSRKEVEEIGDCVREAATIISPGCEVIVCGSFRRGRQFCGDVDVLISHQDGSSHVGLFDALVGRLKCLGFITDELVVSTSGVQQKYLGICKLSKQDSKHRRIDVIVVPYDEFFPALLYFTGSGHFNRSMRNLASKMGMSLNEHGLFKEVIRKKGTKMNSGIRLCTPNEETIFEFLKIPFRPAEERDF